MARKVQKNAKKYICPDYQSLIKVSLTNHTGYSGTHSRPEWIAATDPQATVSTPPSPQMTPEKSSIDKKVSSAASKIMARAGQGLIGFKRDSQKSEKSNTSAGSGDHKLQGDTSG